MIDALAELTPAMLLKQRLDSINQYAQRWCEAMAYEAKLIVAMTEPELSADAQAELATRLAAVDKLIALAVSSGMASQDQIDARLASDNPLMP